jgi:Xaa-Pro aminopeptidase
MQIEVFQQRRERVLDALAAQGGGVAVHFTAPQRIRNRDVEYPYRFDSHYWYLTGFGEPDAAVALVAHGSRREAIVFCRPRDAQREIWDGLRLGPERAGSELGFDAAHAIDALDTVLPDLLADAPALLYAFGAGAETETRIQRWLASVRGRARSGKRAPTRLVDLGALLDEMRLMKDRVEIDTMRRAAAITAGAHVRLLHHARPGQHEYELEAELLHEFQRHGAQAAYPAVVAAGANACVLHHAAGRTRLAAGELCLVDAGCELEGYAADLTRTFPVSGRYSGEQRAVYDLVLAAQEAAFAAIGPGRRFDDAHEAATCTLAQGLVDLGLLAGSLDGIVESGAYKQFFMHRTGHWLGLDVHDVGDYLEDFVEADAGVAAVGGSASAAPVGRRSRTLQPGMTLTVEPGLYLRPADNVPARFHDIGVRIEDDVAVTPGGHEVLTQAAPRHAAEVEAVMRAARPAGEVRS